MILGLRVLPRSLSFGLVVRVERGSRRGAYCVHARAGGIDEWQMSHWKAYIKGAVFVSISLSLLALPFLSCIRQPLLSTAYAIARIYKRADIFQVILTMRGRR
jgi:hypothetical protein